MKANPASRICDVVLGETFLKIAAKTKAFATTANGDNKAMGIKTDIFAPYKAKLWCFASDEWFDGWRTKLVVLLAMDSSR